MKAVTQFLVVLLFAVPGIAQDAAEKIYLTERAFEKKAAEVNMRAAFLEFLTADAVMFMPEAVNARDAWTARKPTAAALTWNPILIDVSSNGALAYSIGNSVFRANGKDDPAGTAGHYLSVWMRQPGGDYRAVLDTGIRHDTPAAVPTGWKTVPGDDKNERGLSAADSSVAFYQMAEAGRLTAAYKKFLADDTMVMRDGSQPFVGRRAALDYLDDQKGNFKFAKRKSFVEAADLAYVHGPYSIVDRTGVESERGNYVQIWRLRGGKWQIVADILVPVPKAAE